MISTVVARLSGPGSAALVCWISVVAGLPMDMARVLAAAAWMLVWWISDAVPLGVTSLLPVVLFPVLGIAGIAETTAPYGSHYVFLFLGGFFIALALERWNLHRRFALTVLVAAGGRPRRLVGGFMLATAALSMWISNTATTLMMLPMAMSVLGHLDARRHPQFPLALLLGTAYAANLGGIATLVGTPPNVAMAGLLEVHVGISMPFLEWMAMAFPYAIIMLGATYVLLTRVLCRVDPHPLEGGVSHLRSELQALGPWTTAEQRVAVVFFATSSLWVCRRGIEWLGWGALNDTTIAMAAGVALFVLPSGTKGESLLSWSDARRLPWDILLLFGGGLTLAGALKGAGVLDAVADVVSNHAGTSWPVLVVAFASVALLLTEVMSNLALTVILVPVVAQVATSWAMDPLLLVVPVTMASSCAFMLPMATPPNAIIFGSGRVRMGDMVRIGFVLNVVAILVVWVWAVWVLPVWIDWI
jgi:sodium-dependent dicarboxylate transporter 2/3/5